MKCEKENKNKLPPSFLVIHRRLTRRLEDLTNADLVQGRTLQVGRGTDLRCQTLALLKTEAGLSFFEFATAQTTHVIQSLFSPRRSILLATRMYGTFGQKCLISGTHIRDTFSSEAFLEGGRRSSQKPQKVRKRKD